MCATRRRLFLPAFEKQGKLALVRFSPQPWQAAAKAGFWWLGEVLSRENPNSKYAPVAQLDRALVSGTRGRRFNSSQARHLSKRESIIYTVAKDPWASCDLS